MRKRTNLLAGAVAGAALLAVSGTSQAVVQTYTTISGTGSLTVTHPGGGFFQNDGQFDDGIEGDFGFSGSDGGFIQEIRGNFDGGLFGTGDNGAFASVDYTGGGGFWFGGLGNDAGPLPSTDFATVLAFGDVLAPAGKPYQFRVESDFGPTGNGFVFEGVGNGTWQTVGGALSTATPIGNFNPNDPNLAVLFAFAQELTAWDTGPDPAAVLQIDNLTFTTAVGTWTAAGGGSWSTNANWSPLAPDGANAVAHFGASAAAQTVTVDGERFAGLVRFDSANSYTLGGTGPLTIRNVGVGSGGFQVSSGNHTVTAPLRLWSDTTLAVTSPSVLTLSGPITARPGVRVTMAGTGRADVSALDVTRLDVNGGTLRLLPGSGRTRTTELNVLLSGKLDITNNPVVVDYASGGPSPLSDIRADVVSGFAGGAWSGNGIVSANANGNSHGVGYGEASALATVPAIFGTVDNSAVLLRLTRYGDANLDGQVNLQDFNRLASAFGTTGTAVWTQGDFNYDGNVNLQDFNRLASNFGLSAAGPEVTPDDWARLGAAVPEPASLGSVAIGAAALLRRRRRA